MQLVNQLDASPYNAEPKRMKVMILYNGTGYVAIDAAFFMPYDEMRKVKSDVQHIKSSTLNKM